MFEDGNDNVIRGDKKAKFVFENLTGKSNPVRINKIVKKDEFIFITKCGKPWTWQTGDDYEGPIEISYYLKWGNKRYFYFSWNDG